MKKSVKITLNTKIMLREKEKEALKSDAQALQDKFDDMNDKLMDRYIPGYSLVMDKMLVALNDLWEFVNNLPTN